MCDQCQSVCLCTCARPYRSARHLDVAVGAVQAADVQQRLHPIQPALPDACRRGRGQACLSTRGVWSAFIHADASWPPRAKHMVPVSAFKGGWDPQLLTDQDSSCEGHRLLARSLQRRQPHRRLLPSAKGVRFRGWFELPWRLQQILACPRTPCFVPGR